MWLFFARKSRPDAPWWHGRRAWAALDALAWPAVVASGLGLSIGRGVVGAVLAIGLGLAAAIRLRRALYRNERYFFTTAWVARMVLTIALLGWLLKSLVIA